jgi:hypothetical protein
MLFRDQNPKYCPKFFGRLIRFFLPQKTKQLLAATF